MCYIVLSLMIIISVTDMHVFLLDTHYVQTEKKIVFGWFLKSCGIHEAVHIFFPCYLKLKGKQFKELPQSNSFKHL